MKNFGIAARVAERKENAVVYVKEANAVIDCLRVMGAYTSLLTFENTRVLKEMRNQVNRVVNCETANLRKTVNTALRQIEKINIIATRQGLELLPNRLAITAEARLAYPEASIGELVELIGDGATKSGVNHRLRKLEQIADELVGGNGC
jgi:DNA-binding protein WhiA